MTDFASARNLRPTATASWHYQPIRTTQTCWQPLRRLVFHRLLEPHSRLDDIRRREFIINVLLLGVVVATSLKLVYLVGHPGHMGLDHEEASFFANTVFLVSAAGLWRLSRRGYHRLTAYSLVGFLTLEAIRLTLQWSFELPITELMYALVIVVAGILLTTRASLVISSSVIVLLLTISYDQIADHLQPHTEWLRQNFQMTDAVGYSSVLGVIALVSWLTNREISQSIARIKVSEAALTAERDNLELKVTERTRELQEAQLLHTMELQRFAEFGRLSASLLHEVSNPLTAMSLNLGQLSGIASEALIQARQSLLQMERYVEAARRQLRSQSNPVLFNVADELNHVTCVMSPLAQRARICLQVVSKRSYRLYGDPIKFNQLMANLIANAIDAYEQTDRVHLRKIKVSVEKTGEHLRLCVQDWGKGIAPGSLCRLFEPFYTTKPIGSRGTGIGLTMIKRIVEEDFHGTIAVDSSLGKGTSFTVMLARPRPSAQSNSKPLLSAPAGDSREPNQSTNIIKAASTV